MLTRSIPAGCLVLMLARGSFAEPAPAPLPADASVDQILDALDASGKRMQSLAADVTLAETDDLGNDTSRRGTLSLKRHEQETTVRVSFVERQSGTRVMKAKEDRQDYLLEGAYLTRRDHRNRKQTRTQIRRPEDKVDLLKLGQGPFPLPVGQPRADVLRDFEVTSIATADGDPKNALHVKLVPRAGTQLARRFASIDVWVDRADAFPHKIETVDANQTQTVTTTLANVRLNADVKDAELKLDPLPDDWAQEDETLKE